MHEHIFVLDPDIQRNYPAEWGDEQARIEQAVDELTRLASTGVRTIVDPTVAGIGRYIPRIQRIAERAPINIIAATGYYTYGSLPFFFQFRGPAQHGSGGATDLDPMVEMFTADITDGIAGTGVRAGVLKCAVDHQGVNAGVERVLRAVSQTHRQTGVPIIVHTHPASHQGSAAARILSGEGVDPRRVVLSHSGDTTDVDHLSALADAGFWLGMDRFGVYIDTTFEAKADTVVEMCRRGYAGSMVLSHDAACYYDAIPPSVMATLRQWHYTHIHEEVLPYLRSSGVTDEQVNTMLVSNPRRYFENTGAY